MANYFFPFLYCLCVLILLVQAVRVMSKGFLASQLSNANSTAKNSGEDRTGQVTIHPEILNKDGDITDEDLLTVRFSGDIDPPHSAAE